MDKICPDISFSSYLFHLQAEDKITKPPYKGLTFRGEALAMHLKKVVCAARDKG